MKPETIKQALVKLYMLAALCFITFGFTTKAGLDSYEIYLNDKLVLQQYVNQPLNLRKLKLNTANDQDELRIHYKHCTKDDVGSGRSITIKDQKGNTLKKWEFADVRSNRSAMVIPVKALRALEKSNGKDGLYLHYNAKEHEHPEGEMLASLQL